MITEDIQTAIKTEQSVLLDLSEPHLVTGTAWKELLADIYAAVAQARTRPLVMFINAAHEDADSICRALSESPSQESRKHVIPILLRSGEQLVMSQKEIFGFSLWLISLSPFALRTRAPYVRNEAFSRVSCHI